MASGLDSLTTALNTTIELAIRAKFGKEVATNIKEAVLPLEEHISDLKQRLNYAETNINTMEAQQHTITQALVKSQQERHALTRHAQHVDSVLNSTSGDLTQVSDKITNLRTSFQKEKSQLLADVVTKRDFDALKTEVENLRARLTQVPPNGFALGEQDAQFQRPSAFGMDQSAEVPKAQQQARQTLLRSSFRTNAPDAGIVSTKAERLAKTKKHTFPQSNGNHEVQKKANGECHSSKIGSSVLPQPVTDFLTPSKIRHSVAPGSPGTPMPSTENDYNEVADSVGHEVKDAQSQSGEVLQAEDVKQAEARSKHTRISYMQRECFEAEWHGADRPGSLDDFVRAKLADLQDGRNVRKQNPVDYKLPNPPALRPKRAARGSPVKEPARENLPWPLQHGHKRSMDLDANADEAEELLTRFKSRAKRDHA